MCAVSPAVWQAVTEVDVAEEDLPRVSVHGGWGQFPMTKMPLSGRDASSTPCPSPITPSRSLAFSSSPFPKACEQGPPYGPEAAPTHGPSQLPASASRLLLRLSPRPWPAVLEGGRPRSLWAGGSKLEH